MKVDEVREWMEIADRDFDSALILNEAVRRHYEIICYHCAQAAEKYLKGYLVYQNIMPAKTHHLPYLNGLCMEIDNGFQNIMTACDFLNQFATDIRYPNRYDVTEGDVTISLNAVEKIRHFKSILDLREIINITDEG